MGSLKGPVVCLAKVAGSCSVSMPMIGSMNSRTEFSGLTGGGSKGKASGGALSSHVNMRRCMTVHCSFNSSSNGSGSMAENFNQNDEDYVNSSIVEAGMINIV